MKLFTKMTRNPFLLFAFLLFAGCGGGSHSFDYHSADDPPPGPGLFSGPDGTFTIYQNSKDGKAAETDPHVKLDGKIYDDN